MTENRLHKVQGTVSIDIDTEEFDVLVIASMKLHIQRSLANARDCYKLSSRDDGFTNVQLLDELSVINRLLAALTYYLRKSEYVEYERKVQEEWKEIVKYYPDFERFLEKYRS
jgi:hypothetical protein